MEQQPQVEASSSGLGSSSSGDDDNCFIKPANEKIYNHDPYSTPFHKAQRAQREYPLETQRYFHEFILQCMPDGPPPAMTMDEVMEGLSKNPLFQNITALPATKYLTYEFANELMRMIPTWQLVYDGGILKLRRWKEVKSVTKGLEFIRVVAEAADAAGQHSDIHLEGSKNLTIVIWTPSVGGVTENDFLFAAKLDKLGLVEL